MGGNNNSAFGNSTNAFGTQNNTGFGGFNGMNNMQNQGTGNPPYKVHIEKEANLTQPSHFQSITAMPEYRNFSFEVSRIHKF